MASRGCRQLPGLGRKGLTAALCNQGDYLRHWENPLVSEPFCCERSDCQWFLFLFLENCGLLFGCTLTMDFSVSCVDSFLFTLTLETFLNLGFFSFQPPGERFVFKPFCLWLNLSNLGCSASGALGSFLNLSVVVFILSLLNSIHLVIDLMIYPLKKKKKPKF